MDGILVDKAIDVTRDMFNHATEKKKFEEIVVASGADMYQHKEKSDETEKIKHALTDDKMKELAERLNTLSPIQWERHAVQTVYISCVLNEVSEERARKCAHEYWAVLKDRIIKCFPGRFDSVLMNELSNQIEEARVQNQAGFEALGNKLNSRMDAIEERLALIPVIGAISEERTLYKEIPYIAVNDHANDWNISTQYEKGFVKDGAERKQELVHLTSCWSEEREQYPGWYIIPYEYYVRLKHNTYLPHWAGKHEEFDIVELLDFYYEYCWRWNTSMFLINHYDLKQVMEFWFYYYDEMDANGEAGEQLLRKWLFIGLCLLRDCREVLEIDKWQEIYDCMHKYEECEMMYGDALWIETIRVHFHQMQLKQVVELILEKKEEDFSLPIRLQAAGVLAECGEIESSIERLERIENAITTELSSRSTTSEERTFALSLLSCAYQLHKCIYGSTIIFRSRYKDDAVIIFLNEKIKEYEMYHSLDVSVKAVEKDMLHWRFEKEKAKSTVFDINKETITLVGGSDPGCDSAYYMYRSLELMSMPVEIRNVYWLPKEMIYYMISYFLQSCSKLGLFMLLRGDNEKIIKSQINHLWIRDVTSEIMCQMLDFLLQVLRYNMYAFKKHIEWGKQDLYTYALNNSIELVQRLASCCSAYQYTELMQVTIELLKENCVNGYGKMDQFVENIMRYVPEQIKAGYVKAMLQLPIVKRSIHGSEWQIELLELMNHNEKTTAAFGQAILPSGEIDKLLNRRCVDAFQQKVVLERLMMLYQWGYLNDTQQNQFQKMLWSQVSESTGLPVLENRYMFACLSLPHPEETDVLQLIKKNLLETDWLDHIDQNGISMIGGKVTGFNEILGVCNYCKKEKLCCWSKDEATILVERLLNYIAKNTHRLQEERFITWSVSDEFSKRFTMIQQVIVAIISTTEDDLSELKGNVQRTFSEVYENEEIWIYLNVATATQEEVHTFSKRLLNQLYSGRNWQSALRASEYLLSTHMLSEDEENEFFNRLLWLAKSCKEEGCAALLITLHNCFYSSVREFTPLDMEEIGEVLDNVRTTFEYRKCLNEKEMKQYILIRSSCSKLAYEVHCYCERNQIKELEAVARWCEVCGGEDFVEVKNGWLM